MKMSFFFQTQITGFAEAVVNFTENFVEKKNESKFQYRYVNTSKQLHVYILVESGKFIVGTGINKWVLLFPNVNIEDFWILTIIAILPSKGIN